MISGKLPSEKGFSLVEMIFYIAILAFLVLVISNLLFSVVRIQRVIKSSRAVENSGISILERLGREVRLARNINATSSTWNNANGSLKLESIDAMGADRTVEFYLSNGVVRIRESTVDQGPLSLSEARVTSLKFFHLIGTSTEAVKTEMAIESGTSTHYKKGNFYLTTALRKTE